MSTYFRAYPRAANDLYPRRSMPLRTVIVAMPERKSGARGGTPLVTWFFVFCALIEALLWFGYDTWKMSAVPYAVPAVAVELPPALPVPFIITVETPAPDTEMAPPKEVAAVMPKQVPPVTDEKDESPAGIMLPAEALVPPDEQAEAGSDKDLAFLARQIADTPALKNAGEAKASRRDRPLLMTGGVIPSSAQRSLDEARAALDANNDAEAIALYDDALAHDRNNRAALAGKAYALQRTGDYAAAAEINRRLLARNSRDTQALANLAASLSATGTVEASAELEKLVDRHPHFAPARASLARLLGREGRMDDAIQHMRFAVQDALESPSYQLNLAILCDRAGRGAEALALYRRVLHTVLESDAEWPATALPFAAIRQRATYLAAMLEGAQ